MMYQTIGFIGTGNMGSAVARAAAKSGLAETILLSNRTPAKAEALAAELPGAVLSTNEEIARSWCWTPWSEPCASGRTALSW